MYSDWRVSFELCLDAFRYYSTEGLNYLDLSCNSSIDGCVDRTWLFYFPSFGQSLTTSDDTGPSCSRRQLLSLGH